VIVKVDDASVATPADMSSRLRGLRNKTASFVVVRDRKDMTLSVAIGDEDHNEWFFKQDFNAPAARRARCRLTKTKGPRINADSRR